VAGPGSWARRLVETARERRSGTRRRTIDLK
jgi:hypothetical protein